ncbi:hypothetical protein [Pseudarthrobacter sulfonivorans]|uniref:hypothetical protein n=1 Tax=Pseudarthrobacter sulfonivorans TaxID=121292 RepID=UPI0021051BC0|nr:hypothetical protein [Pseudarthrobacter sulfonivorans]
MSFYGQSGIGKSALSRHLDSLVSSGGKADRTGPITYRHDFAKSGDRDFETLLIAIRARLAAQRIPAPAFDLAFSLYWSMAHPGEALKEYLQGTPPGRAATGAADLGSVMTDALSDLAEAVLDTSGFGLIGGAARLTTHAVRTFARSSSQKKLLLDCPHLDDALDEKDLMTLLAFLPYFLAWDLGQQQIKDPADGGSQRPLEYIIFFDTWEDIQSDSGHLGSLEDLLCGLMFLMPNCLFVVTGRERLRWADVQSQGQYVRSGPDNWPGLISTNNEPRQHLLDRLTDDDSGRFLNAAWPEEIRPPENVLTMIVAKSNGYPAYLKCAVDLCNIRRQQGLPLTEADLSGGFPKLFTRTMRGLSPVEQNLLQAAALIPAFNIALLEKLVPQALSTELRKFTERHFVEENDSPWLDFRITDGVRLLVASSVEDGQQWTAGQKQSLLTRAAHWVSTNAGAQQADVLGRARVFQAVRFLETVSAMGAVVPATAVPLIFAANSGGYRRQLALVGERGAAGQPGFAGLVHSICALEGHAPVEEVVSGSERDGAPGWMADLARVAAGRRALLEGDIRGCLNLLAMEQSSDEPEIRRRRRKLEVLAGLRSGKLEAARRELEDASVDWCSADEQADLLGHVWFWNGSFMRSRMSFAVATQHSREHDRQLELARGLRHLARVEEVMGASNRSTTLEDARELNVAVDSSIGIAQMQSIDALVAARAGHSQQAHELLHSSLERLEARSAVHDVHELCVIAALVCFRLAEPEQLRSWRAVLNASPGGPESKQLSAAVLSFLDVGGAQRHATGRVGAEFTSAVEARDAWRRVSGLQ